jgi:hypothetical protein
MTKSYTNMRRCIGAVAFCAAAGLLATSLVSAQENGKNDEVFGVTNVVSLSGGQKIRAFDISFVDPVISTYVLADRTNKSVDVINTKSFAVSQLTATPPFAGAISNANCPDGNGNDCSGPDGVIIVNGKEVWAGDGPILTGAGACPLTISSTVPASPAPSSCSTVKVVDLASGATTHVIPTGGLFRADESCLDTKDGLFMTANNADSPPFATIISIFDYKVKAQIKFDGTNGAPNSNNGAEQCQWDPRTGLFYISIPGIAGLPTGSGGVAVINPTTGEVVNTFLIPLKDCSTPQGMAVGPDKQIMIGCNGSSADGKFSGIIMSETGSVSKVIPNESGPDEIWYNPGNSQYFLARSAAHGANQLLGVVDASNGSADQSIVTANKSIAGRNAHSVAADAGTNRVFVPIPDGVSTICGTHGGVDANGCIAVFTTTGPDEGPTPIVRLGPQ